jgi:dihydrofolate reductase
VSATVGDGPARPASRPLVSIVVAMDENRVIGAAGGLPWRLPEDLRWFRRVTMGKPVVMGRRTHESIGRALPGRHNIVITRRADQPIEGCTVVDDLDGAIAAAGNVEEVMIIGGAQVYALALARTDRLYLTELHAAFEGDTWFPPIEEARWRQLSAQRHEAGAKAPCPFTFRVLERRRS